MEVTLSPLRETAVGLLADTVALAELADRQDLVDRLTAATDRVRDPRTRVVVVGEFKQGKSQLVNSLLGIPVCAVDDDITTAVPTVVAHAEANSAELLTLGPGETVPTARSVDPVALADLLVRGVEPETGRDILRAEVGVPHPLLAEGLVLVDTPGAGGVGSRHASAALGLLPTADAVLFVSDAGQEYTEPEMAFLRQALALCPTVGCLLSKVDLYPQWREVRRADRDHLDAVGIGAPLIPVSSLLRSHALKTNDAPLNAESGFPEVLNFVRHRVIGRAEQLTGASVAHDVTAVADHLGAALKFEKDALRDPALGEQLMAELVEAKTNAESLRQRSSKWQQTLNDGATDLLNDIEHDLRDRLRRVVKEAEGAIDGIDPGASWEQFTEWVEDQVVRVVCDNFVWAHERSVWLAETVAEHFAEVQEVLLPQLDVGGTEGVLEPVTGLDDMDSGRLKLSQKLLIGMRGSYGGVLMFGMVTSLMGMALLNPVSIGAGLLLGTKAYRDEKEQRLNRRRNEAKVAVRRMMDDVVFQVNKQSKDRLRGVQRVLRDHFVVVAEQTLRTLNDTLVAGRAAAKTDEADRDLRIREIERRLAALGEVRARSAALADSGVA